MKINLSLLKINILKTIKINKKSKIIQSQKIKIIIIYKKKLLQKIIKNKMYNKKN